MKDRKYIELKVVGHEPELIEFLKVCRQIQYLGDVGSSRTITLHVDGDGSGRLKFEVNGEKLSGPGGDSKDMNFSIGE